MDRSEIISRVSLDTLTKEYDSGLSLRQIADLHGTYPTSIRRVFVKNNIPLRHDFNKKGEVKLNNGDELIAWAKAQGRLVTKAELANHLGTQRLSDSYFVKYPELHRYIAIRGQQEIADYIHRLNIWLQEHNFRYKSYDRSAIGYPVHMYLTEKNIILQIAIKSKNVSRTKYEQRIKNS